MTTTDDDVEETAEQRAERLEANEGYAEMGRALRKVKSFGRQSVARRRGHVRALVDAAVMCLMESAEQEFGYGGIDDEAAEFGDLHSVTDDVLNLLSDWWLRLEAGMTAPQTSRPCVEQPK